MPLRMNSKWNGVKGLTNTKGICWLGKASRFLEFTSPDQISKSSTLNKYIVHQLIDSLVG